MSLKVDLIKIFVYGTLKRGQPNNIFLNNSSLGYAKFIGKGTTDSCYPLVVATKWRLPFLLYAPNVGKNIEGEVYEIDEKFLSWADDFEGHPLVYERQQISVNVTGDVENGTMGMNSPIKVQCWAYFLMKFPAKTLHKPHLSKYEVDVRDPYDLSNDESCADNIQQALLDD